MIESQPKKVVVVVFVIVLVGFVSVGFVVGVVCFLFVIIVFQRNLTLRFGQNCVNIK